ncbi:DUF3515 domain-containing protein [Corynebacterium lubricantis]|uniref:DUF3515 domain-containing protein n=1 Tax=Corynebacterium lubricantis TaxID=541095 RepID=UPI00037F0482|nr:DUF3515 domain-containing protein [Corynebacterium lubricantis]
MNDDTPSDDLQFNRTPVLISLGLAIALVIAVIFGARWYFDSLSNQPIAMSPIDAPDAESAECTQLIDSLPDELLGNKRAEIIEPVPAGVAAWQTSEIQRITLRCGVNMPLQYTEYAQPVSLGGVEWLRIDDATPESTLSTWYSTDRYPVVAVTADESALDGQAEPVSSLPISSLAAADIEPGPAPLSQLAAGSSPEVCSEFLAALPESVAEGYSPLEVSEPNTVAWASEGQEPVVVRCDVAPPENYQAGEQLQQINDVTWFEDTQLINGSTASTWFALGRETEIAVSVPQFAGNSAIVRITEAIEETVAAS